MLLLGDAKQQKEITVTGRDVCVCVGGSMEGSVVRRTEISLVTKDVAA